MAALEGKALEIVERRIDLLMSMLRRCHAAIRCDDNERIARGSVPRWAQLDKDAQDVLDGKDPTP